MTTDAERIEAWQWRGYANFILGGTASYTRSLEEQQAFADGWLNGIRPDADDITATETRGRVEALLAVRRLREMGTAARDVGVFYDALDDLLRDHGLTVDEE